MYIEFDKEYLRELFENGHTNDRKHRYQPEVIRGYQKAVFTIIWELLIYSISVIYRNSQSLFYLLLIEIF